MIEPEPKTKYGTSLLIESSRPRSWGGIIAEVYETRKSIECDIPPFEAHQILILVSGIIDGIGELGGTRFIGKLTPGNVTIIPAGTRTAWSIKGAHRFNNLWLPPKLVDEAFAQMTPDAGDGPEVSCVVDGRDFVMERLSEIVIAEMRRPEHPAQRLTCEAAFLALAAQALTLGAATHSAQYQTAGLLSKRAVADVMEYIENNLDQCIGLAELGAIAGVSRFHITRSFRKSTGISPMEFLEQTRIRRAMTLLRSNELRLSEVALAVGFADQSHFTRRFRAITGVTPGAFRKGAVS